MRNVTASHTTVVAPVVVSIRYVPASGSAGSNTPPNVSAQKMTSDAAIAEISDHALMRHQYQRRISPGPVPAPSAMNTRHAPSIDPSFASAYVDAPESRNVSVVIIRAR